MRLLGAALQTVVLLAALPAIAEEDSADESSSSDIITVMAWCKDVQDGLDWGQVLQLAKRHCNNDMEEEGALLRITCSNEGLGAAVEGARLIVEHSYAGALACANGVAFLLGVALAYAREALTSVEVARAQVLLWQALQENFMLDASVWPVKTYDILEMFDRLPAALEFPEPHAGPAMQSLEAVTMLVPRCPPRLVEAIQTAFPAAKVAAGVADKADSLPSSWTHFNSAWEHPTGFTLNRMLEGVDTPFVLVIMGAALPLGPDDIGRMVRVLEQRRVVAVGGPVISEDRVYSDFCYRFKLRHYRLGFDPIYEHSLIFDEGSSASIRGSWFHENDPSAKEGPCKACETLPPTFLARTDALRAIGFHPLLDGEWGLLEAAMRASRSPLVEVQRTTSRVASAAPRGPGRKHVGALFASCPFANIREVDGLRASHLYGRSDMPASGVAPAEPWFSDDAARLGAVLGRKVDIKPLRPSEQAKMFMQLSQLREFIGPEGVVRHFGCNLATTNCNVPDWVYRGWAAPPCCKETMRHLLFYIDGVFSELGIRYVVSDGVLLGSYKFGGMLDWDADVDLHIHTEDFDRLEEVVQHRVKQDGHHLRKHVNNQSWLLQANDHNYLLIELNKRKEHWDPDRTWQVPIEGRLFPAMEDAHLNLSTWYGLSFFRHRLRHVPEWEEEDRPMFCATPYHYNCVDELQVPAGRDCAQVGIC